MNLCSVETKGLKKLKNNLVQQETALAKVRQALNLVVQEVADQTNVLLQAEVAQSRTNFYDKG